MSPSLHDRNAKVVRRLLLLLAVVIVLLMPVEYRAGAERPHPHALLQLVWEASQGTLIHHGRPAIQPGTTETAAGRARMSASSHVHSSMNSHEHRSLDAVNPADDVLMSATLLAITLVSYLAAVVQFVSRGERARLRPDRLLVGVTPSLEPPPPKTLLLSCT